MANNVKWRHNTAYAHTQPTHSISNNQHNWENSNSTAIINKCFLFCLIFTQLLSIIKARQIRDIDSRWRYSCTSTQNGNFVSFSIIHFLSICIPLHLYLSLSLSIAISLSPSVVLYLFAISSLLHCALFSPSMAACFHSNEKLTLTWNPQNIMSMMASTTKMWMVLIIRKIGSN